MIFFVQSMICSSMENLDVVVVYEANKVGEYERQLTSTLFHCGITMPRAGLYNCSVVRTMSRGGQVMIPIWSIDVPSNTPNTSPSMMPPGKITIVMRDNPSVIVTNELVVQQ